MINLTKQDNIFVLTMNKDDGNMVDAEFLEAFHETLDKVEAESDGPGALVITGVGKAFSTGLNLAAISQYKPEQLGPFFENITKLKARLANFPLPTIAAINGHAFAAGAFLALSCDFRVMREDRGWFCISEVDVGVPVADEMMALVKEKLTPQVAREAVLLGKRYSGEESYTSGIVDGVASEDNLVAAAIDMITPYATKERNIFKTLKSTLYGEISTNLFKSLEK